MSTTKQAADRRHFSRVSFQHEITLTNTHGTVYPGAFNDISLRGMLFWCEELPSVGERLFGHLPLGPDMLHIKGTVLRVTDMGAAIHFEEMDVESFGHLRRLVALNVGDAERIDQEFFSSL